MLTTGLVLAAMQCIAICIVFVGAAVMPSRKVSDASNVLGGLVALFLAATAAAGAGGAITAAFVVNS